jgi:hypothetical protein
MKKQKRTKLGRPKNPKGRGQVMSFYASPETEETIRKKADAEDKTISAVIADSINAGPGK